MTLDEIPQLFRDTWAVYEAFRRLGFTDDEIVHVSAPAMLASGKISPEPYMSVVLRAQRLDFTVVIGPLDRPYDEAKELLERLRLAIRDGLVTDATLSALWQQSKMADVSYFAMFCVALINRGFTLPKVTN